MTAFGFETTGDEVVSTFPDRVNATAILITGPSPGGIGAETARMLSRGSPLAILLAGRTESKLAPLICELNEKAPSVGVHFIQLDLSSQKSVRASIPAINSALFLEGLETLDLVINNGAIMACPYALTEDGIESQFATNYLGHWLLTNLLLKAGLVRENAEEKDVRIVNVSSNAHSFGKVKLTDINFTKGREYSPLEGYAQSKMANILHSRALAARGITSFSVHPGSIPTNLQVHMNSMPGGRERAIQLAKEEAEKEGREFKVPVRKTIQQGCTTTLVAALDPSIAEFNGYYLVDGNIEAEQPPIEEEKVQGLWKLSEELCGEQFDF